MKKTNFYQLLLLVSVCMFSCNKSPVGDTFAEDNYQPNGAVVSTSGTTGCFLVDPTISIVEFNIDETRGDAVSSVEVLGSYNGGPDVSLGTVNSFPTPFTVNMVDLVNAAGVTSPAAGDGITLSFLSNGAFKSNPMNFNVGCVSNLAGNHPFVGTMLAAGNGGPCPTDPVTGTVTFTDLGCGVYGCSDLGFGQYESSCWNDSPATNGQAAFSDICNTITAYGADQYGLAYSWVIAGVDGPELTITWSNNYADSGTAVITKEDGTDWPALQ